MYKFFLLKIKKLYPDNTGNIILLTAVIFPFIFISTAFAIDISQIYFTKTVLQKSLDNALITTASYMSSVKSLNSLDEKQKEIIHDINQHFQEYLETSLITSFSKEKANKTTGSIHFMLNQYKQEYVITADCFYTMPITFYKLLSLGDKKKTILLPVHSSIIMKIAQNPASIDMVLDISGSMNLTMNERIPQAGQKRRIDILKESVKLMINHFTKHPNLNTLVRVGAITFNDNIVDVFPLTWDITNIEKKITHISAKGYTNSFPAMQLASNRLFSNFEKKEHEKKGNKSYMKYVIFMTDGDNNTSKSNIDTIKVCDDIKKRGGKIYVVGVAVKPNKVLQQCPSSKENLYYAFTEQEVIRAFAQISDRVQKENIYFNR